jgi:hypothetical protein
MKEPTGCDETFCPLESIKAIMLRIGHKDVVKTELSFGGRKERMD